MQPLRTEAEDREPGTMVVKTLVTDPLNALRHFQHAGRINPRTAVARTGRDPAGAASDTQQLIGRCPRRLGRLTAGLPGA